MRPAPSEEDCSAIFDWADDARSERKPEDDSLAEVWDTFIDAAEDYSKDACPSGNSAKVSEAGAAIQDAYKDMQSRPRLRTLRELTPSGGPG